jgi:hypothetical protein
MNSQKQRTVISVIKMIAAYRNHLLVVVIVSMGTSMFAQSSRLSGEVHDPTDLPVVNAKITVHNNSTGVDRVVRSNSAGLYTVEALEPGPYGISVEMPGFSVSHVLEVTILTDTASRIDLALKPGGPQETVTVTDEGSPIQTETASLGTVIREKQYNDLALVQQGRIRSPAAFIYLAPSVQGNYTAAGAENTSATNQFIVNGSQEQVSEFYLEGLAAGQMRTVGSFNESAPPVDAVREFKVTTTLLPADYGHTGTAASVFTLKTGTNKLHGSVYEYFRNNALDAQPWGSVVPLFTHQNEFGATLGGPIVLPRVYDGRNRSFFFFSYGGSRKSGVDSYASVQVPTAAELTGDFSGARTIYDPSTTVNAGGTAARTAFTGNVIPVNRFDPVAKALLPYFPQPNTAGSLNFSAYKGEKLLNPNVFTFRLDHNLTGSQKIGGAFIATTVPRLRIDTPLPAPLTSGINQVVTARTLRLNHDVVLGANKFNQLDGGYNRFRNQITPVVDQGNIVQQIGLPGINTTVLPTLSFTNGYTTIATNSDQLTVDNDYQIKDTFSWVIKKHSLRMGGEFRRTQLNDTNPSPTNGTIAFSSLGTANPNSTGTTGDGFASFLLGQAQSGTVIAPLALGSRRNYFGIFVQDDFKATAKLTLNLGMRWEFQTPPTETKNQSSIVDLSVANVGAGNLPGALIFAGSGSGRSGRSTLAPASYRSVSPRFGFAYSPSQSTVLRGGYGIYYSDFGLTVSAAGFQPQASYSSTNNGVSPAFVLSTGYPQVSSLQPTLATTLLNGQSATYYDQRAGSLPTIQEWTLGVQQSFKGKWSLQVDYVGNRGERLIDPAMVNINQLDPKYLALGSLLTQSITSAGAVAANIAKPYAGFTGSVAQALRAFPQFQTLTDQAAKAGSSNYNALQTVVTKRTSYGLTLNANYTWSKNLGYNSPSAYGGGVTNNVLQNAFDPRAEYSLLPLDVRNAFVMNYIYELPFGSGKPFLNNNRWENLLLGNWRLSGIQRYQTGYPLLITETNTLPIFNSVLRPNIVPGISAATHNGANGFIPGSSRRINPAAFSQPASYTFGNARPAYSGLNNFAILDEDLAAVKSVALREHLQWNLYVQMFNALNRHRFTAIDTNFSDAAFGQASIPSQPRFLQLGTRFEF